ncbi:hypothetical protein DTL41_28335 [Escherichia coli]|nr:hypothetical protein DTL41_28335 [Escherichia coli]
MTDEPEGQRYQSKCCVHSAAFQRCWLPVSRIGLHRRGVERVNCGPKLLDLGEKGVYSSYTLKILLLPTV